MCRCWSSHPLQSGFSKQLPVDEHCDSFGGVSASGIGAAKDQVAATFSRLSAKYLPVLFCLKSPLPWADWALKFSALRLR
jgi:hypothetical protein